MVEHIDTIIVGGGQSGLSIRYYLTEHDREHVIFQKSHQPASAWRNRWDSFTLNTPNWMTCLPGAEYHGNQPDKFMPRDEIVSFLEAYIDKFGFPIRYGIQVTSIKPCEEGYLVSTDHGEFQAANVVFAAGEMITRRLSFILEDDISVITANLWK